MKQKDPNWPNWIEWIKVFATLVNAASRILAALRPFF